MNASPGTTLRILRLLSVLATACGTAHTDQRPRSMPSEVIIEPPASLYGAEEALRDVLSGPLTHLGTGPWPGNGRMHACAFRNARVIVVNVYCGITDTQAFRVEVYSPTRGRVRIYAESKAPVSAHVRDEYFTFTAETEPAPVRGSGLPPLTLRMKFRELQAYDETRQASYLPACYGGVERQQPRSGCLGPLAPEASTWAEQNGAFLKRANEDWYRVVRELRTLAVRHGIDPN